MSVNSYLEKLSSDLVLDTSEKNSISTSIETLEGRLSRHFGDDIKEKFCFGSYTRGTILPRKGDKQSDIDYMIVFNNDNQFKPQTFLDKLRAFAVKCYSTSEIHQSYPTIILRLNHINFELVPAYDAAYYGNNYKIPAPNNEYEKWTSTDPNGFNIKLTDTNISNNSKIKPMIRLIKYWNTRNNHVYSSYSLEKHLINSNYSYLSTSLKDYFYDSVEGLVTWDLSSQTSIDKVNKLKEKINEIKQLENDNCPFTAETKIEELLPNIN
ncbi:MAG TPA: nucleotidyltransferase domain-containing protein [Clostridium sp.]|uniref:SMODS domain-containing nucleotidyltransferase n=1 Tax=Clostridium sp. TaxID=1506 RepID=UPI002F935EDB